MKIHKVLQANVNNNNMSCGFLSFRNHFSVLELQGHKNVHVWILQLCCECCIWNDVFTAAQNERRIYHQLCCDMRGSRQLGNVIQNRVLRVLLI